MIWPEEEDEIGEARGEGGVWEFLTDPTSYN